MPKKGKKIAARQARVRKERRKIHHDGSSAPSTPVVAKETPIPATKKSYNETMTDDSITTSQITESPTQETGKSVEVQHIRNPQTSGSPSHSRRLRSAMDVNVYVRKELFRISVISCVVISVLIALTFVL